MISQRYNGKKRWKYRHFCDFTDEVVAVDPAKVVLALMVVRSSAFCSFEKQREASNNSIAALPSDILHRLDENVAFKCAKCVFCIELEPLATSPGATAVWRNSDVVRIISAKEISSLDADMTISMQSDRMVEVQESLV